MYVHGFRIISGGRGLHGSRNTRDMIHLSTADVTCVISVIGTKILACYGSPKDSYLFNFGIYAWVRVARHGCETPS